MTLTLITDDTPTGYLLKTLLNHDGSPFNKFITIPYGEKLPKLEQDTYIVGNFNYYPKNDVLTDTHAYYYFPSYAPKWVDTHTYFSAKMSPVMLFYGYLHQNLPEYADSTVSSVITLLHAFSGKGSRWADPQYTRVIELADKMLTYADLYKDEAEYNVIYNLLNMGKTGSKQLDYIISNVMANEKRYVDDRIKHTGFFSVPANYQIGDGTVQTKINVAVISADWQLQRVGLELSRHMPKKEPYVIFVSKGNFITVVGTGFEDLVKAFGDDFKYQGANGTYSMFMQGLDNNTLYKALKEAFGA